MENTDDSTGLTDSCRMVVAMPSLVHRFTQAMIPVKNLPRPGTPSPLKLLISLVIMAMPMTMIMIMTILQHTQTLTHLLLILIVGRDELLPFHSIG